ncbi:response regulator transcription factor [Blastococcus sp. URHD0036]|uniref:response regulator n=1 Tax=Blastococcus sp. URHD0036 TaxID=1380356 RepID=UPI0004963688|nr:response regulator transcription factor [Blastococcus sp. URHD0036]
MSRDPVSVVLVDDQQLVRDGLRLILELAGVTVVGEAADGADAVPLVLDRRPDVVLMDLRMPVVDGVEATRRIVAAGCPSRVVVLTTFEGGEHAYRALRAGASGYLLKDAGGDRIVAAVRAAAAGEMPLAPAVVATLVASFTARPPAPLPDDALAVLSDRERDVLALVGAGRSNGEIAAELFISTATVKTHVRHLLAKLDLRDRAQAIVRAHECGLVAGVPEPPARRPARLGP